ncbi:MAG: helix-turn-helix transcriptional regulator [Phycisphaeraceae bacterium JB051]
MKIGKRDSHLRKMRHIYSVLHHVQLNGFDEMMWRKVLLQGLKAYFGLHHVWSGIISENKVGCIQDNFDELAISASAHPLIQMCDQFEQRWGRTVDHHLFDVQQVIDWVGLMLDENTEVWFRRDDFRLEKIKLKDEVVLLATYRINQRQLRCVMMKVGQPVSIRRAFPLAEADMHRFIRLLVLELIRMIKDSRLSRDSFLSSPLSPREAQTARYLLNGYTEKQIAKLMYLSPHTVHTYIKAVYRLFGVSSRAEFTALFISHMPMEHYFKLGPFDSMNEDDSEDALFESNTN